MKKERKYKIGMRVGRLEIIGYSERGGYVICRCDCGTVKEILSGNLAVVRSCGCLKKELTTNEEKAKSLVGTRVGKLRVLGCAERKGYLVCECDCGTVKEISAYALTKQNPTRSCGCLKITACQNAGKASQLAREPYFEKFQTNFNIIESQSLPKNNKTGQKGVFFDRTTEKYFVFLQSQGTRMYLGRYDDLEEAVRVRKEAEEKYHKPLVEAKNKMEAERESKMI